MTRSRRARILATLLGLAVLPAVVWVHRVHVDRPARFALLLNADVFGYFYPTAAFVHRTLRGGSLPLWNPNQFAGQPFLGLHVPGALYPPNLAIMGLLDPRHALAAGFVFHAAISGVFTWLFAARLGLGPAGRLLAALVYMLSGPTMFGIYMPAFLASQAWLPAILWALHGLLAEVRPRWAIALAASVSLAFLPGHAQGFVYTMQFAVAYGLFGLVWVTPRGRRWRALGLAALGALVAVGLVAPQLLPALELAAQGTRDLGGVPLATAAHGQAEPPALLRGLVGGYASSRTEGPLRWLVALPAASLLLAVLGLRARRLRAAWLLLLGGAVLTALFMLGTRSPVFPIYHALPLGNLFRNPVRIAFLYVFLAAMLAGIGVDGLREVAQAWLGRRAAAVTAALVVAVTAVELYGRTKVGYGHPFLGLPVPAALTELAEFVRTRPGHPRVFIESTRLPAPPPFFPKAGTFLGFPAVPDYEPNMPAAYRAYFRPDEAVWHGKLSVVFGPRDPSRDRMRRLLDLMSVRYYATLDERPEAEDALRAFAAGPEIGLGAGRVFERPSALPRAYAVRRAVGVPDVAAALEHLAGDAFDPRRDAVVVGGAAETAGLADLGAADDASGSVDVAEIVREGATEVVVGATCRARCLLILTDLHYPGWRAEVDGRAATVHTVNALFRGVILEPGAHRVVYGYAPASLCIGGWLFAGAAALALAAVGTDRRRRRDDAPV